MKFYNKNIDDMLRKVNLSAKDYPGYFTPYK